MNRRSLSALALAAALAAGLGYRLLASAPAAEAKPDKPQTVTTVLSQQRDVPVQLRVNGNVSSLNLVEVRPQISNLIREVKVREGAFVKAGEVLFVLDDRNEVAALKKAQAQLAKDRATLADMERQVARGRELIRQNFISQSALDSLLSQADALRAAVAADQAAVEEAKLAQGYNVIRAPGNGRAGAIKVHPGSLVQSSAADPLVTLTRLDPIAVSFTLPEREVGALIEAQKQGAVAVEATTTGTPPVTLKGRLSFVDNTVNSQSGTILLKAEFANPDYALWPGAYVNVRIVPRVLKRATVLPAAAVQTGPDGKFVYVVGTDKTVAPQTVTIAELNGLEAAVDGLKPGVKVVLDGGQNLQPGGKIVEVAPKAAADKKAGA